MKFILLIVVTLIAIEAKGQVTQLELKFQRIEVNILRDSFQTATLTITETDTSILYSYQFKNSLEVYTLKKDSVYLISWSIDNRASNLSRLTIDRKPTKRSSLLGELHRLSLIGVTDGEIYLDSGSSGFFSLKYGLVYLKSHQTNTGKILFSIDGMIFSEREKYDLYYR